MGCLEGDCDGLGTGDFEGNLLVGEFEGSKVEGGMVGDFDVRGQSGCARLSELITSRRWASFCSALPNTAPPGQTIWEESQLEPSEPIPTHVSYTLNNLSTYNASPVYL